MGYDGQIKKIANTGPKTSKNCSITTLFKIIGAWLLSHVNN